MTAPVRRNHSVLEACLKGALIISTWRPTFIRPRESSGRVRIRLRLRSRNSTDAYLHSGLAGILCMGMVSRGGKRFCALGD